MLQVEQEKQFTHQALQRADTTVRPDVELAGPSKPAAGPARQSLSQMDLQLWNTPPPLPTTIPQLSHIPTTPYHPTSPSHYQENRLGENKGGRGLGTEASPSPSIT